MAWSPVRRFNARTILRFDHPGDYAILNSYHPSTATSYGTITVQVSEFPHLIPCVTLGCALPARSQEAKEELRKRCRLPRKPGEWRYLNGDPQSTRYSPLDQINKDNFKDLKIAWRWKPAIGPAPPSLGGTAQGNGDPTLAIYKSESTPIMINGVLYTAAAVTRCGCHRRGHRSAIVDMDGDGRRWPRPPMRQGEMQGAALRIGRTARTSGFSSSRPAYYLVALDAKTGVPVTSFGVNGAVDLMNELNVQFDMSTHIGNSSPPMVYNNTVIIPPALEEGFVPVSMRNTPG